MESLTKLKGIKPVPILLITFIGVIALRIAYLPVFHDALFFTWLYYFPFFCLCVLTIIYFLLNIKQFLRTKKIFTLLSVIIGAISIILIILQHKKRENWNNAPSIFTATTNKIGNDGGLVLQFKNNGILKATKMDHWAVTYYWGTYRLKNDTVDLDIPLDFDLGRKAVLGEKSLRFLEDTIVIEVQRFYQ
ncbi:hypothetical protein DVR12_16180 [Chitinophaga silvatica]|uniref:Uncharacterized protein n=1 Tax=Chitinophaga silvatica TaxID=2282649 RepID=A0A3E1Y8J5_9BACT|nr:hypothetical protein [Chitinophaga silvatica]RFS21434.1 hypothetical protein DVR12_16180 [Chitinophaga silvatica]